MEARVTQEPQPQVKMISQHKGFTQKEFDSHYGRETQNNGGWKKRLRGLLPLNAMTFVKDKLPVLKMARSYRCKDYIVNDFFSGLSVALMAIPQSFGYARIANIPEIIGLYTSFFPVVVYFIFTTSRHVSMGTMALSCLLIGSAVNSLHLPSKNFHQSGNNGSMDDMHIIGNVSFDAQDQEAMLREMDDEVKILLTVSLSCAASLILLLMSFFKMGFIVSFMSDAFVSGFLASTTLRVLIIELKDMLGVHPGIRHAGFCEFFMNTYEVFKSIGETNLVQVGMSVVTLVMLISVKEFVNKRYRDKLLIPIPIEIIVVVIAVLLTKFTGLESNFEVEVSTGMRSGLPSLVVPSFWLMYDNILTSFLLAIISFMMVGMMAKLFARNHDYQVDDNQEMFAMGTAGIFGSFFCSMIPSTSPPRCFLADSSGGKTQLVHLFSALFALLAMVAFAPLLRDLPVCVLACIIVVTCIPLFPHFLKFYYYWKTNKYECSLWFTTFATVLMFSVETGMLVGISLSLLVVHVSMKLESKSSVLEKTSDGVFLDGDLYSFKSGQMVETSNTDICNFFADSIVVFRFESLLYFATLEDFRESLFSKVPSYVALQKIKLTSKDGCSMFSCLKKKTQEFCPEDTKDITSSFNIAMTPVLDTTDHIEVENLTFQIPSKLPKTVDDLDTKRILKRIIVDCSNITYCDISGAELLAELNSKYLLVDVDFCLAACNENVKKQLSRVTNCRQLVQDHLYPTIHDAYHLSSKNNNLQPPLRISDCSIRM